MAAKTDSEIVWEDPPEIKTSSGRPPKWRYRLAPLMGHPNCWARVAEYPKQTGARSAAHHLHTGLLSRPPGRWEFAARGTYVYARYLGPEGEE